MTENDINEEESTPLPTPPEADKSLARSLKRAAPFAAGIVAFLIGVLLFAPLEAYAFILLRQLGATGVRVDIGDLSLSALGRFKAQSVKVPLSGDNEKQGVLKIAEIKGKIALLGAILSDKYDAETEAVILSFSKGDFGLKVDSLEITSALEHAKSGGTGKMLNGSLSMTAESAQVTYRENKYLKEEIVIPFLKIVLKCRAHQNAIAIETGEAMGRLINAQIKGTITLSAQTDINLNIILKPTNEFFEKYQDKDPRTLLKFAGILQEVGRIEFNLKGTLAQPVIEAVTVKPALPGAPPAPPAPANP
jgi:type II secretion system protein N